MLINKHVKIVSLSNHMVYIAHQNFSHTMKWCAWYTKIVFVQGQSQLIWSGQA